MATRPTSPRGETGADWLARHWLLIANVLNTATIGGAALAPVLRAAGWTPLSTLLYLAYRYLAYRPMCPQRPAHSFFLFGYSFFLFGYKMALEQRMVALFGGLLLGGLLFAPLRARLRPLDWRLLVLLNLPLLVDALSQTVGLRGSTWAWRVATGLLGSLAAVWWAYPYVERAFAAERRAPTPADEARRIMEEVARRSAMPPPQ